MSCETHIASLQSELAIKDREIEKLREDLQEHQTRATRNYHPQTHRRRWFPEYFRREIAINQKWRCANPDGCCTVQGAIPDYDVDHIIPLHMGGTNDPVNMLALCLACHRRKTELPS